MDGHEWDGGGHDFTPNSAPHAGELPLEPRRRLSLDLLVNDTMLSSAALIASLSPP
jgi:hypothetical protein